MAGLLLPASFTSIAAEAEVMRAPAPHWLLHAVILLFFPTRMQVKSAELHVSVPCRVHACSICDSATGSHHLQEARWQ